MEKAKSIKMLSCFVAVAIAICLLIVFVNTSNNQGEKQSVEEVNIKNRIKNIYSDLNLNDTNVDEKYLSENLRKLMDKAYSLVDGPEYIDYNIWTNSQDHDTLTAIIVDCYFINKAQAIARLQVIDSRFGELSSPTLYLQHENGDWFVDDIIEDRNSSLKIYTIKFIEENK
ncbi:MULTISPECIES: hypothetical protein [Bacteroidaceae]|uniref:hypothetical protein n=1 Tax=Bacteroidaceae TaxID=815 RepID=UPI0019577309|nr:MULTISPECIES: hypothetical protein [Bacteroidaceae]MBM6712833.1 hypothetical protein [Phocaeicola coprocola]MBM6782589.1 hypothetical protein [Bacteroides mediterraneensis]